jgi:hypothetical protein
MEYQTRPTPKSRVWKDGDRLAGLAARYVRWTTGAITSQVVLRRLAEPIWIGCPVSPITW